MMAKVLIGTHMSLSFAQLLLEPPRGLEMLGKGQCRQAGEG